MTDQLVEYQLAKDPSGFLKDGTLAITVPTEDDRGEFPYVLQAGSEFDHVPQLVLDLALIVPGQQSQHVRISSGAACRITSSALLRVLVWVTIAVLETVQVLQRLGITLAGLGI